MTPGMKVRHTLPNGEEIHGSVITSNDRAVLFVDDNGVTYSAPIDEVFSDE